MSVIFYPNYIHYVGFVASAEPSITTQNYACSGGETTGAAYDLVDNRRTNQITIDTSGEGTDFHIELDLSVSITVDTYIIDNHNLKTADAQFEVHQGGAAVTYSSSYSGTLGSILAIDSETANVIEPAADGVTIIKFTSVADAGWDLIFTDIGGTNFGADCLFGEIAICKSFTPSFSPELNQVYGYKMPGYTNVSGGGQKYGFAVHNTRQRTWRLNWKYMSDSDKTSLQTVFKYTNASQYPFYIDLGESATPHLYYVRFVQGSLNFTELTKDAWAVSVMIEEEI